MRDQFKKVEGIVRADDYPYDYESAMHYPSKAFGLDPNVPVLKPKKKGVTLPVNGHLPFSALDYESLKDWYGCGKRKFCM